MGISVGAAMIISAVVGAGAAVYSSSQTPEIPDAPVQVDTPQIVDKSTGQVADQVDEVVSGDEESKKRKKQTTKSKFKVDKDTTGVSTDITGVPGVQI